jgi:hypothetical protein
MKKSELKMIIREIVREEVRMELKTFLKEYKTKTVKKPVRAVKKSQPLVDQKYSNNPTLNSILNETAQTTDWDTLGDDTFTTQNMSSVLNKQYGNGQMTGDQMVESMGVSPETVPDHVTDALTKDYSQLMKTMDKKKKGGAL